MKKKKLPKDAVDPRPGWCTMGSCNYNLKGQCCNKDGLASSKCIFPEN